MSTSGGETRFSGDDSSDLSGGDVSLLTPVEEPTGKGEKKKTLWHLSNKNSFRKIKRRTEQATALIKESLTVQVDSVVDLVSPVVGHGGVGPGRRVVAAEVLMVVVLLLLLPRHQRIVQGAVAAVGGGRPLVGAARAGRGLVPHDARRGRGRPQVVVRR